jgi:beta-glucosidase
VIDEIYNDATKANSKGVLASFGTTSDALLDIVSGRFHPTGKMPFTSPISEAAVDKQLSDVPGNLKGPGYALFKFKKGLEYKKKK